MRAISRTTVFAMLLLLASASARAQTPLDPSGHWEGAIVAPFGEVPVQIDLTKNANGELVGTFSNQSLKGFPLTHVVSHGAVVSFEIKATSGGIFDGLLMDDGKTIAGDFAATPGSAPFSLTRKGDARIEKAVPSAAIAKQFEGLWSGTLEVDGTQVHIALRLSNQADGTAAGTLANVEEGIELPIAAITQRDSTLALDVKVVTGSYTADLNAEGTELAGTWKQGPLTLPLTLRKGSGN